MYDREFQSSPVVKTPHFHCRGHGFYPWSRNYDSACYLALQLVCVCMCIYIYIYIYIGSRKMVLMNLFSGKEWRCRCREQTCGHSRGRREWDEWRK